MNQTNNIHTCLSVVTNSHSVSGSMVSVAKLLFCNPQPPFSFKNMSQFQSQSRRQEWCLRDIVQRTSHCFGYNLNGKNGAYLT